MKRLWIKTPQGKVEAWFIPARRRNASGSAGPQPESDTIGTPGPAVIFAHGNGELIDDSGSLVRGYTRMGVHVMLCEYRGYGRSAGAPSEKRLVADHVKCYDRLAAMKEVDPNRIFFHGRSLGTGVVCGLSTKRNPAGLILQSPFSSAAAMMARYWIPRIFVLDPFDNLAVLQKFEGPVLLFHGTRDRVVPFSHSKKLHRANPQSTFKGYSCGHNNFPYGRRFWGDVRTFLKKNRIL